MSESPSPQKVHEQAKEPGFCSATCTNKECLHREICKPPMKTSDVYVCNLPKKFDNPHWFNGYGSQLSKQHPFYRTTSSEYGWYAPDIHTVPITFVPKSQKFSSELASAGIHSVPSVFFPAGQRFTNHLSASGMYRNYSLNTGMDPPSY